MDLPHNILLYLLLLAAVAAGYLLERKERKRGRSQEAVIKDYYQGLNFLLGDRPELGVDRFIEAMEVSDHTVDVHLAMAGVVRRRGEVDKAIRIHQNLLASPVLNAGNKQLVEMELARDYHSAGLWDRSEKLLTQIVARKGAQTTPALELLLDLYEQEREWRQAIDVASQLMKSDGQVRVRLSHFHCELAEEALTGEAIKTAQQHAASAVENAPTQPRGHWLAARIEAYQKRYKRVVRHIQKAVELNPQLVAEYLAVYRNACENLGDDEAYEAFLRHALTLYPDPRVLDELISFRRSNGNEIAVPELLEEISRAPSFGHLPVLLELGEREAHAAVKEQILDIVNQETAYHCTNCGFHAKQVLWHCPTCKSWGSFGAAGRLKSAPTP